MNRTRRHFLFLAFFALVTGFHASAADESARDDEALGKLKLGQKAAEVTLLLGKPESTGKDTEWGATGEWVQEWRFQKQGLTLNMASGKKGGAKTVLSITATAPCQLATERGIHLGSTAAEVTKAYSDVKDKEHSKPGESFVAGSIYGGVIFTFAKGMVSEIFIGAAAE